MPYSKQFANIFRDWAEHSEGEVRTFLRAEIPYLKTHLKKGTRVLDVGCGYGRVLKCLRNGSWELWGMDNSRNELRQAKHYIGRAPNVHLVLGDVRNTGFPRGFFDAAYVTGNTFGNLGRSKVPVLKEFTRIVRKGGSIIVTTYNEKEETFVIRLNSYRKMKMPLKLVREKGKKVYIKVKTYGKDETLISEQFSKQELKTLFHKAGLRARVRPLTKIGYICVAKVD